MKIIPFRPEDRIVLKKTHPCGNREFRIVRVGEFVRIICLGCGRDMNVERIKLEKAVKEYLPAGSDGNNEKETRKTVEDESQ